MSKHHHEVQPLIDKQAAQQPYAGPAYEVPGQAEMLIGPFYDPNVEQRLTGAWSDGLCSCCSDAKTCMIMWCLPCLLFHPILSRLPSKYRHLAAPFGIRELADPLVGTFIAFFCPCLIHLQLYYVNDAVSSRYHIAESFCHSCFNIFYCTPLLLARLARHTGRAQGFIRTY